MNISFASPLKNIIHKYLCFSTEVAPLLLKKPSTRVASQRNRIIDKIRIYVRGGSGGQGCPSTGGVGGNGGHVFIKCLKGASLNTYSSLQNRRIIAGHGSPHNKSKMKISHGKNTFVYVPPGTEIKSSGNILITEVNKDGELIKIVNGGAGGSAKTQGFNGGKGERKNITLELKLIADAALTGFPNAGKSSLLRVLSRARPKVGDYPFTTINPMIGSIFFEDNTKVTVADLPGLIEDAHLNKGMGHKFLRHVERTKVILLVVDINGFQLQSNSLFRSPFETIILLLKELALYQDVLLQRPFYLVFNKMDSTDSQLRFDTVMQELDSISDKHPLLIGNQYACDIVSCVRQIVGNKYILIASAKTEEGMEMIKKSIYQNIISV